MVARTAIARLLLLPLLSSLSAAASFDWTSVKLKHGGSLPDFSYCGYHYSNNDLPAIDSAAGDPIKRTRGDLTSQIQDALNSAAKSGQKVVLLGPGSFELKGSLKIPSGVTLRGQGVGKTFLYPQSANKSFITMGDGADNPKFSTVTDISDSLVTVGATLFTVEDASKLKAGQDILVQREVTAEWVRANGMADLGPGSSWSKPGRKVQQPRKITSVSGKTVAIDVPLTDAVDKTYGGASILTYTFPPASSEMGVESLTIDLKPTCAGKPFGYKNCDGSAIEFPSWTTDSWVRSVNITGFNQAIHFNPSAMRHTVDGVQIYRDGALNKDTDKNDYGIPFNGYEADINVQGTYILVRDTSVTVGASSDKNDLFTSFPVATSSLTPGPNAVVNLYSAYPKSAAFPHERWAHGFLVDNSTSSVEYINRGDAGSGHGWSVTSGVGWNVNATPKDFILNVSSPPLGENLCIGCTAGKRVGNGTYLSYGAPVTPVSLFAAQLAARRG